ncbi:methylenetetrahydrofolate reductase [NAD(P)H] [Frankia sp. AvcI1]|uniref:methylenetetrahydrofolate reductase [NAD(P)H] n=2 Tax=Frankia sp. AvcI1 TaxID=573496 RepID=UPI002118B6C0|nr:methylenetetrahydrofolate reductase [NAD(P)H] [Frankia sp. AvcI1]
MTAARPIHSVPAVGGRPARRPTVREFLASGATSYSFEFFPPKTPDGERHLWQALREIEQLRPSFVSVTYGAGGSTRDGTLRNCERIATETSLTPIAHLTAVNHTAAELRQVIGALAGAGIRDVLALRGDPPGNPLGEWVRHPAGFNHADELVRFVRSLGDFCVGVAAFPDKHPRATDLDSDARALAGKFNAGASYAITQFFFDADDYFRLVDRLSRLGHDEPILPGIMPVTNVAQITRMAQLSGAAFPPALARRLEAVADDPEAVQAVGVEVATALCARLLDAGAPGIHFITLNRSTATREVHRNLLGSSATPARQARVDRPRRHGFGLHHGQSVD